MVALLVRPPTVLVVEDDAIIRMVATDLVEDLGFAVFEVANADAAFAMLEAHDEISIVFTDIHMAGSMDGLDLAVLTQARWPAVGLVVVSGEYAPEAGRMPGGAKFFSKPYNPAAVQAALLQMSNDIVAAQAIPDSKSM